MKYIIFWTFAFILNVDGLLDENGTQEWFIVAVYEHIDNSSMADSVSQRMLSNLAIYKTQTQEAAAMGAHIIVFPEYGLIGLKLPNTRKLLRPYLQLIPSLKVNLSQAWTPCDEEDTGFNVTVIHGLSCIAKETGVVVVANLGTLLPCGIEGKNNNVNYSCPEDKFYHFNTNIVFNENGTVLAVYHKINLYHEPLFNVPPYTANQVITFQTQYTTFGLITCFDIIWKHPLITLVKDHNVKHVIYTTAWFDGLPFLTSVQCQFSWSIGLNITLIAANLHMLTGDRGGSGIYSGNNGILNYTYGSLSNGHLLIANISEELHEHTTYIENNGEVNYSGIIYDNMSNYTFTMLNITQLSLEGSVQGTSNAFTCNVRYKFQSTVDNGQYYLIVYKGTMTLGFKKYCLAVELCTVAWCADGDPVQTCSRPPVTSNANITFLELKATFSTQFLYPSILDYNLYPINTSLWTFTKKSFESCRKQCCFESSIESIDEENINADKLTIAQLITNENFSYRPLVTGIFGRLYDEC